MKVNEVDKVKIYEKKIEFISKDRKVECHRNVEKWLPTVDMIVMKGFLKLDDIKILKW